MAAAKKFGVGFAMSAFASVTMEELTTTTDTGLKLLNIYIYKKRHWTENLAMRAESCGFHGLILGITKLSPTAKYKASKLGVSSFANVRQFTSSTDTSDADYPLTDPSVTWEDVAWLKSITKLPIIIKGVLSGRDALEAVNAGVDGILVSNHGGRQLADVPAPIDVLVEVIRAVGNTCEVYLDGGVRSGADIFKALGLGAKAVFIGRPILWGMACGGVDGVMDVLAIYESELRTNMHLSGVRELKRMPSDIVVRREIIAKI